MRKPPSVLVAKVVLLRLLLDNWVTDYSAVIAVMTDTPFISLFFSGSPWDRVNDYVVNSCITILLLIYPSIRDIEVVLMKHQIILIWIIQSNALQVE